MRSPSNSPSTARLEHSSWRRWAAAKRVRRWAALPARPQGAVEIEGGADEREMREGLGEVPEPLTAGTALLGVETEVVRVAEHLLEHEPGLLEPGGVGAPGAGEGLDQPERADVERALLAAEPVHRLPWVVPVH